MIIKTDRPKLNSVSLLYLGLSKCIVNFFTKDTFSLTVLTIMYFAAFGGINEIGSPQVD